MITCLLPFDADALISLIYCRYPINFNLKMITGYTLPGFMMVFGKINRFLTVYDVKKDGF